MEEIKCSALRAPLAAIDPPAPSMAMSKLWLVNLDGMQKSYSRRRVARCLYVGEWVFGWGCGSLEISGRSSYKNVPVGRGTFQDLANIFRMQDIWKWKAIQRRFMKSLWHYYVMIREVHIICPSLITGMTFSLKDPSSFAVRSRVWRDSQRFHLQPSLKHQG